MATVKVYLNVSRDSFFGFYNDFGKPVLVPAITFELDDELASDLQCGAPYAALERVFEQLNIGGHDGGPEGKPWTVEYRQNGYRSLSVGDVVVIGELAYAVESSGWRYIPTDDLTAALQRGVEQGVGK